VALLSKEQSWEASADPTNLVGVVHTMEAVLARSAASVDGLRLKDYFVSGQDIKDSHHNVPPDHLVDVIAALSTPVTTIAAAIDNLFTRTSGSPAYGFDLWVSTYGPEERPVQIELKGHGPMSDRTDEVLTGVFREFMREIGRRNRSAWIDLATEPPPQFTATAPVPSSTEPTASPRQTASSNSTASPHVTDWRRPQISANVKRRRAITPTSDSPNFFKTLITHPLPVTVIGGILASGIIFLIGLAIVKSQNAPQAPPTTITVTATPLPTTPTTTTSSLAATPTTPTQASPKP
jgi:hypothetical protein